METRLNTNAQRIYQICILSNCTLVKTLCFMFQNGFRVIPFRYPFLSPNSSCSGFLLFNIFVIFQASENQLPYPGWALAVLALLIVFAMLPVPVCFVYSLLQDRRSPTHRDTETGHYSIVNTEETLMTDLSDRDQRNGFLQSES